MKNTNKFLFVAVLGIGLAVGGIVSANADTLKTGKNHMSGLVTAIAQRFNLNEKDVEQVFVDQFKQHKSQAGVEHKQTQGFRHGMTKMPH